MKNPMKRTSVADPASDTSTVARLLSYIDFANLKPGTRLPSERELAELLRTSRGSVREALAVLDSLRVVEVRSNSGIYLRVRATDYSFDALVLQANTGVAVKPVEIRQSMEVRTALELKAVDLACRRRTKEDLHQIRRILAETEVEIANDKGIEEQDHAFHLALAAATQNDIYARVLNSFYWFSRLRRRAYFSNPLHCRQSQREHIAITEAIASRNSKRACALILKHMKRAEIYWGGALNQDRVKLSNARKPEQK